MTTQYDPLAATHTEQQNLDQPNVQGAERAASLVGGGLLLLGGLRRGGLLGLAQAALGAMVTARGVTGRCKAKQALTPSPFESQLQQEYGWTNAEAISRTITIGKPREEVYAFVRSVENLPLVLRRVERVQQMDTTHYHWIALGPQNRTVEWDAHIEQDVPNEKIVWSTESTAYMQHKGTLLFKDAPNGLGTELQVILACEPPAGTVGYAAASLISQFSGRELNLDLRRLKQLLETGEITHSLVTTTMNKAERMDSPASATSTEGQPYVGGSI
ncbi:putative membrane protein [Pseudomonas duriflava]|uniref:Putative membrane protein n=1 Tax=Pseudomonas duriflava TaxID=459528 RepID=A0A562Q4H1_9PSED|nr:SRPBCC family protein [Pseudomonas duriflava]TWI50926.1 putative membrane protein [Pseudomonas duriflava]